MSLPLVKGHLSEKHFRDVVNLFLLKRHICILDDFAATSLQDMVNYVVTISRCLYAQIVSQAYQPPPDYMLPLPSEEGFAAAQLGMKLVSAFEMVLARRETSQAAGNTTPFPSNNVAGVGHCHSDAVISRGFFLSGGPSKDPIHKRCLQNTPCEACGLAESSPLLEPLKHLDWETCISSDLRSRAVLFCYRAFRQRHEVSGENPWLGRLH